MTRIDELFAEAQRLQDQEKLPQAMTLYEQILTQNPNHEPSLCRLAFVCIQLGDHNTAIHYLQRALALDADDPGLHNNLANAYRKNHQLDLAIHHYKQAIALKPDYAQAYSNLAAVFAMNNDYRNALEYYRRAIHAQPDFTAAHYNLGLLLLRNNQLNAARIQFNNVLALNPDHLEAYFYLGVLSLEANQLDEAEKAFQHVIMHDNTHVQALTNLGVIALKRDRGQLAVDFFTKALTLDNNHLDARNNLAATFMHHDRFENALMHYDVLLKQMPDHIEYLYNSGVAQMALGHLNEAIHQFEHLLSLEPQHFAALNNLAAVFIRLEDKPKAIELLHRALAANPEDAASRHMLNALQGNTATAGTCTSYAANLFNNYALYYDKHMREQLKYTLPLHIESLCREYDLDHFANALDLGCGTGLTGEILRPLTRRLTGVDIAAKMVVIAREKGIYDELIDADIHVFLSGTSQRYDLITAADVLPYFGDLHPLFSAVREHLMPEGYFIFSIEISDAIPWQLQESARFCHHADYIESLCRELALKLIDSQRVIARQQNNTGLPVLLFLTQAA
ncbi:tetratricopeptide repeat protein [Legionella taurinensis]|uniref:Methyltransferase n=1 Tax=Legionella taurinensis TaxID=70611 RepID=A0A3A5L2C1_9GAMM|nr:tetratricopeptide repeat protein [Legionella taurinensis]MDX1838574.1 tetratricopeptide repeat protein [Legionella taurinensis]PUT39020.1 methyltransferase [Legionella taurinensis]PUT41107.1 methyltransferase [Legionella taurinensis]PUT43482.1 methyltransferase [Legionella taurinensis]PUT46499.1 methyltransferase [Legionella taurinensis]